MGFCKNWGMTAPVNVMLHTMGWGGHHITRAQNGREFFKKMLYVVSVRYHCGGWSEEVNSCILIFSSMVYL